MKSEIVRLPASDATSRGALLDHLLGHPYFDQDGLTGHRVLEAEASPDVILLLEWADDDAPQRAIASEHGQALVAGLDGLLTGPPEIAYYRQRR
jgi:quinol monooxygenase YgiN